MFTFLRKIRKSLIESGSTGKYLVYAVGEIALVVIGILIALQVNNWNENQKNESLGIMLKATLLDELKQVNEYNSGICQLSEIEFLLL